MAPRPRSRPAGKDAPDAAPAPPGLEEYRAKRDFEATPEPPGATAPGAGAPDSRLGTAPGAGPARAARTAPDAKTAPAEKTAPEGDAHEPSIGARFVVQEHHARALHWDLRLERDGVLASWAVPRGIPPDPRRNHLAVHTEDHPIEYLDFEGEIPAGEYGAGSMRVFDTGTYDTHKWSGDEVMVTLHGERVRGRYVLFRTKGADWMIHRMDPPEDPARELPPDDLRPMLATLTDRAPAGPGWAWELKWDGIRALAYVEGGRARFCTRRGNDVTHRYPELRGLGAAIGARDAVLDGEIVAFDDGGRPDFGRLQQRMHVESDHAIRRLAREVPVVYIAFDLLWLDGHSQMDEPYERRRARLADLGLTGAAWQTPPHEVGDGDATIEVSRRFQLEGVVAKRVDSRYEPGRRSGAWRKVKHTLRQELVVGGWTDGTGERAGTIGSLLVGYYDDEPAAGDPHDAEGATRALRYAGRVGSGLTRSDLATLEDRLATLARTTSPFASGRPPKGSHWVEPELVVDVRFTEWTRTGSIRHPVFLGLRDDKAPREVVREGP